MGLGRHCLLARLGIKAENWPESRAGLDGCIEKRTGLKKFVCMLGKPSSRKCGFFWEFFPKGGGGSDQKSEISLGNF